LQYAWKSPFELATYLLRKQGNMDAKEDIDGNQERGKDRS